MNMTAEPAVDELLNMPLGDLIQRANAIRAGCAGTALDLCTIQNAKSGHCSEDCKFCAQSGRHATGIETYPLKSCREIVAAALQAREIGSQRFGIITSGNCLTEAELDIVCEAIAEIRRVSDIAVCGSLGALAAGALARLKAAGMTRYHHNIETSERFYPNIVSTHTYQDRLATIHAAKQAGLEVCSGVIIGLGEDWQDRIDMAYQLRDLKVDSVPINILVPIKGTPLENQEPLACSDIIRTICIFRILFKKTTIKIAAGRESALHDFQALGFMAGANGMLIGGYLTVKGRDVEADQRLVREVQQLWGA
jgi:biotin synthase